MAHLFSDRLRTGTLSLRVGHGLRKGEDGKSEKVKSHAWDVIHVAGHSIQRAIGVDVDITQCMATELRVIEYSSSVNGSLALMCPDTVFPGHNVIVDAMVPELACLAYIHPTAMPYQPVMPTNLSDCVIASGAHHARSILQETTENFVTDGDDVLVPRGSKILAYIDHPLVPLGEASDDSDSSGSSASESESEDESEGERDGGGKEGKGDSGRVRISRQEAESAIVQCLASGAQVDLTKGFNLILVPADPSAPVEGTAVILLELKTVVQLDRRESTKNEGIAQKTPTKVIRSLVSVKNKPVVDASQTQISETIVDSTDAPDHPSPSSTPSPVLDDDTAKSDTGVENSRSHAHGDFTVGHTGQADQNTVDQGDGNHSGNADDDLDPSRVHRAVPGVGGAGVREGPGVDQHGHSGDQGHQGHASVDVDAATPTITSPVTQVALGSSPIARLHESPLLSRWDAQTAGHTSGSEDGSLPAFDESGNPILLTPVRPRLSMDQDPSHASPFI